MRFMDQIAEVLGGLDPVEATAPLRYGVGGNEKARMALQGQIPGAPPANKAENPEADRYASTYLGAKKWGGFPAKVFNALAFDDIGNMMTGNWKEAVRRKHWGGLGIEQALRERSRGR